MRTPHAPTRPFAEADLASIPDGWRVGPPDFVGIGGSRAGTEEWRRLVASHPQVVPNRLRRDGLRFFARFAWRVPGPDELELYRRAFARPAGTVSGEWTADYLSDPLALDDLAEAAPDARLVAILQNPVDAVAAACAGTAPDAAGAEALFADAMHRSRAADGLRRALALFGRERVLVLQHEACLADPEAQLARTYAFLGIDPAYRPEEPARPAAAPEVDAEVRARLARWFGPDVHALAELAPELDLALWPDFAQPELPAGGGGTDARSGSTAVDFAQPGIEDVDVAEGDAARTETADVVVESIRARDIALPQPRPVDPETTDAAGEGPRSPDPLAPWPLRTAAILRVFAWPDYDDPAELERLFEHFGAPLVERADACLCLRRDPGLDPEAATVAEALRVAHARVLGEDAALEILLIDEPLSRDAWTRLGRAVQVVAQLPSAANGPRADAIALLGATGSASAPGETPPTPAPEATDLEAVDAPFSAPADASRPGPLSTADADAPPLAPELEARIEALHPWLHPVRFGAYVVTPGIGTPDAPDVLEQRTALRATRLVDAVVERVDLEGRSVLDLGCGCGYWSARYARRGARAVVGVEGREASRRQAELYWSHNAFLPEERFRLVAGERDDPQVWAELRALGPFDITLCTDLDLEDAASREVLARAAEVTREALVVEATFREHEARPERRLDELLASLNGLGLQTEVLAGFPELDVPAADDDAAGRRATVVARKVAAPRTLLSPSEAGAAG